MKQRMRTARLADVVAVLGLIATVALTGCGAESEGQKLDRLAETYVRLAFSLDREALNKEPSGKAVGAQRSFAPGPREIDSWFGPAGVARGRDALPRAELLAKAQALRSELPTNPSAPPDTREERLAHRVDELLAVLQFLMAESPPTFPEEAATLYSVTWREPEPDTFVALRESLDAALPGRGSLRARIGGLRQRSIVPSERRLAVFKRALEECRRRTLERWPLPPEEQLEVITTRDVDSAWHVYNGNGHSTLLLNELALGTVDRAIDVACHEGYPGHHTQFVLFENAAGAAGLPLEDQLVLLRSPASALREGAAMYGVELAFPADERLAFERDVLFPLAGIDPELAPVIATVRTLLNQLEAVVPLIIRDHEDNRLSDSQAILRLQTEALVPSPQQLFAFAHEVGAYLAGYTLVRQTLLEQLPITEPDAWSQLRRWLEQPDTWADVGRNETRSQL